MKLNIYVALCLLLVAVWAEPEPTHLTYFVEYEEEQEEDFIEVTLEIEAQSRSLVDAIASAGKVAAEVSSLANNYCREYFKKGKGDCKEAVDVPSSPLRSASSRLSPSTRWCARRPLSRVPLPLPSLRRFPRGHRQRLLPRQHRLLDRLLPQVPRPHPQGFRLAAPRGTPTLIQEKDSEEAAIKEGLEQGEGLCEQVGLTLGRIIDIEEVVDEEEEGADEGGEEEEDGEEAEEEPEVTVYKFEVECVPKGKAKAK